MTYKEIMKEKKSGIPDTYQSNNEIFIDLRNLLSSIKMLHGKLILDPEDQKGVMPPRTPKVVLEQIAENIAADDIIFRSWEDMISDMMSRLPEDPVPEPVKKVPWYRRCFFNQAWCR